MWPFNLSVRLPIVALVGRYLTNQLIGREAISKRIAPFPSDRCRPVGLCGISSRFQLLSPSLRQVPHALLTRSPLDSKKQAPSSLVRLACVRRAASVRPEPGSNSLLNDIYHLKSVKSLFAQHAIACVLCELLCLELFNVFFQHENRFRYKFFDIVQFSRSCSASAKRLTTWLFYHRSGFLSSFIFSKFFVSYRTWNISKASRIPAGLSRVYWFFSLYF